MKKKKKPTKSPKLKSYYDSIFRPKPEIAFWERPGGYDFEIRLRIRFASTTRTSLFTDPSAWREIGDFFCDPFEIRRVLARSAVDVVPERRDHVFSYDKISLSTKTRDDARGTIIIIVVIKYILPRAAVVQCVPQHVVDTTGLIRGARRA